MKSHSVAKDDRKNTLLDKQQQTVNVNPQLYIPLRNKESTRRIISISKETTNWNLKHTILKISDRLK